jgi:transposase
MENIILPSVNAVFPQSNFIYQHYNCPIHTPRIISYWMEQQGIRVPPWPSRSPDLNPIENMWGLMIRKMNTGNQFRPQNVEELWERIQETN